MRTELERTVQPSLLDRLTDEAPQVPVDPPMTRDASVRAYRASVQRDLGWLLNTRRSIVEVPPSCGAPCTSSGSPTPPRSPWGASAVGRSS